MTFFGKMGWGTITANEKDRSKAQSEYFVHVRDTLAHRDLRVGQTVRFEIGEPSSWHPQRAVRVEVIASADSAVQ